MIKFSDLKLDPKVLKAVAEAGYETPTPIQAGAIPPALNGQDVLGIAQTGTGKTASFTLPMITRLARGRARARMPRSLVLCPTRELAAQVAENFDVYAKYTRLTKALLIGGVSFGEQDKLIDRGVDVLIATPGRLLDHFERGKLLLTGVEVMVVDEADRMLDMGFIPDIERIFQMTPMTRQTLFFSATMAPEIERITNTFLHSPERVEVARQATTSETITQRLLEIRPSRKDQTAKQKRELLRAVIESEGPALKNAMIFCNRKTEVDVVAKSLKAHGYDAAPIHGDLDQSQRTRTLEAFRDGSLRFLVASDVAARGLDVPAVSHVFNFDLPSHAEDYVHRIGRTGRAGLQGTAYSIATPSDEKYLAAIENLVKHALPRVDLPEGFAPGAAPRQSRPSNAEDATERKPTRSRSRSRPVDRADAERKEDATPVEAQPVAEVAEQPEKRAEPQRDTPRSNDSRSDSRRDNRAEPASRDDNRNSSRGEPRTDGRGNDRRRNDRQSGGPSVLGMGDHVPDFMRQSFAEAIAETEVAMDRSEQKAARAEAEPADVQDDSPAEKPRRSRSRSRKSDVDKPVVDEADQSPADQAVEDTGTDQTAPNASSVEAAEPAEKPKRTRSRRKTAAPKEAEGAAEGETAPEATDAEAEKPKPKPRKRPSRAKAPVKTISDDTGSSDDAEAPKPKRSRTRSRAKPATDDTAQSEGSGSDAAADKD